MFKGMKVVDCHIHYSSVINPDDLVKLMDYCDTDMINIVTVPDKKKLTAVPDALVVKHKYPDRIFVFAGLDAFSYFIPGMADGKSGRLGKRMAKYALRMRKAGCDGIKMIEGKPEIRKMLNVPPFSDDAWSPFFSFMENTGYPILWHVNDPEEFWDKDKIPGWAAKKGWLYNDTYVNNETQYREVLDVLERYPNLKIIFAHFFFMSATLDRLSEILDTYPNVNVDLTPGIEMYMNFSKDKVKAKAFFEKYSDRIMYGTDIGTQSVLEGSKLSLKSEKMRSDLVKRYISATEDFDVTSEYSYLMHDSDFTLSPLGLCKDIQQKILSENFLDFVGHTPYRVDMKRAFTETGLALRKLAFMRFTNDEVDFKTLRKIKKYFKQPGGSNEKN